jgi:hypothetical protein
MIYLLQFGMGPLFNKLIIVEIADNPNKKGKGFNPAFSVLFNLT